VNIVVIGAGAAGMTAASNIRKFDEQSQIIVFTTQKNVAYSPCAIPYVIGGHIDSFDDIIMHKPEDYLRKNIRVLTETTVTNIDNDVTEVEYEDKNGNKQVIKYDKLVIATGGKPLIPPIPGKDLEGVFKVRTVEDGEKILAYAEKSKNVILVGGGAIGLELGSELSNKGLYVTIAEMMPQLFPRSFDQEMSDKFQEHLEANGIKVLTSSAVESINGDTKVESVTIDGKEQAADMVILSTGVRSQIELAESIGCELGQFAIKVNDHMETSVENVYAAGDCVEVVDAITGNITLSPLGTTAVRQGIVIAKNITGHDVSFKPVLNSTVSQIGDMEMGAVGLTQQAAEQQGLEIVTASIEASSRARYYPGSKPVFLKLVAKLDGTIIGCQIFGKEAVAERVDTLTAIISQGLNVDEVVSMEFSYAPPVSSVIDPIAIAAELCLEKLYEINPDLYTITEEEATEDVDEKISEENTEKVSEETTEEKTPEDEHPVDESPAEESSENETEEKSEDTPEKSPAEEVPKEEVIEEKATEDEPTKEDAPIEEVAEDKSESPEATPEEDVVEDKDTQKDQENKESEESDDDSEGESFTSQLRKEGLIK